MKLKYLLLCCLLTGVMNQLTAQSFPQEKIEKTIQSIMEKKQIPGLFVTVVRRDTVLWQKGMGYTDLDKGTAITSQHLFRIGSISKTFTALAIMKLVNEGKLNLNDELRELAPEVDFDNDWKDTHPVLLVHLLEHKAGFDDMHFSGFTKDREQGMTALDEVRTYEPSLRSRWKPGMVHSYSNPGYVLLGYLIEKTSGMPYQDYIRKNVLEPLGMHDTHYISEQGRGKSKSQFAVGYDRIEGTLVEAKNVQLIGEAAGALLSSAEDMSRFVQFMLNAELQDSLGIVNSATVKEMEKFHGWFEQDNGIDKGYGLGIYTKMAGRKDLAFLGHNGGINGFVSDYVYSREHDLGIAVSNNLGTSNRAILNAIVDELVSEPAPEPVMEPVASDDLTAWEGDYRMLNSRNGIFDLLNYPFRTAKVSWENDSLQLTMFMGSASAYYPAGGRAFKTEGDLYPSLYLANDEGDKALYFNEDVLVPVNSTSFLVLRILIGLSLLTGVVATLVFIVRLVTTLLKKSTKSTLLRTFLSALPYWLLVLSFYLFLSNSGLGQLESLGAISGPSVLIFLLTLLFPFSVLLAAYHLYKHRALLQKRVLKVLYTLLVFGSGFLALYCISFGWFALRFWAY